MVSVSDTNGVVCRVGSRLVDRIKVRLYFEKRTPFFPFLPFLPSRPSILCETENGKNGKNGVRFSDQKSFDCETEPFLPFVENLFRNKENIDNN